MISEKNIKILKKEKICLSIRESKIWTWDDFMKIEYIKFQKKWEFQRWWVYITYFEKDWEENFMKNILKQ